MKKFLKILFEAIKEPARELVIAAIPGILAYLGTLNVTWATVLYLAIRALDSYLHELGRVKKDATLVTGLTRF